MKTLHVIDHLGLGGAQTVLGEFLRCWPEPSDSIHVVALGRQTDLGHSDVLQWPGSQRLSEPTRRQQTAFAYWAVLYEPRDLGRHIAGNPGGFDKRYCEWHDSIGSYGHLPFRKFGRRLVVSDVAWGLSWMDLSAAL